MQNNLDKFVKGKFQEREFEFNAAHWEGAAALIEKDEQVKLWKNFGWASLAVVLFFAGGIGGYFLSGNNQTTIVASNNSTQQSAISSNEDQTNLSLLETSSTTSLNQNTTEHTTNDNIIGNTSSTTNQLNSIANSSNKTKESPTIIYSEQSNIAFVGQNISTTNLAEHSITPSISNRTDAQEKAKENTKEAILKPVSKAATTAALDYLALSPLANEANHENILQNNINHPIMDGRSQKLLKGIMLGGTTYATPSSTNIGMTAGLTMKYKLRPQISLNADLIYQYRSGNFSPVASTTNVNYSFGKKEIENQLLPTSLHYVELPVYLQYQIGSHFLEGGLSASYLVGVRGGIAQKDLLDANPNPIKIDNGTWLEKDGFKSMNAQVMLGYQFGLSQNASIGLRANYTLGGIQNISTDIEQSKLYFSATAKWFLF